MIEPENNQPTRSNRTLVYLVGVAGLLLCIGTAVAGYAIGRATATPQATAIEAVVEEQEDSEVEESVGEETAVDEEESEQVADIGDVAPSEAASESAEAPDSPTPLPTDPPQQVEPEEPLDLDNLDITLLNEVWELVEGEFYGDLPSNDELINNAISGSLESLDDEYTRYVRADIAALLREDFGGSVEGIGAFVRENDDGFLEIVAPIEGQPADLIGLQPGDIVLEVDGEDIVGQDFYAIIAKVRGPRGTDVTLTILREGEDDFLEFTITRARFEVPIVESEMLEENIAYVRLTEFSANAGAQLTAEVEALLAQNPDGLILDLRNNPGGFLDQSVIVSDLFLPEGTVLFQRDSQGGEREFNSDNGDAAETIPLVVLVNAGSASASEIVAGAIQDRGRGTLIGELTFGKGSVQLLHELSDGSELRVTIARWFTPDDNSINGIGITPDIEVLPDFESDEDVQLQEAIEFLQN